MRLHRIRLQFSIAWFSRSSRRTYSRKENPSSVLIRRESSYSTRDTHTKSGTEVHKTRVKEEEKIQFYSFCVYVRFCSPSSWNKKKNEYYKTWCVYLAALVFTERSLSIRWSVYVVSWSLIVFSFFLSGFILFVYFVTPSGRLVSTDISVDYCVAQKDRTFCEHPEWMNGEKYDDDF